MISEHIEYLNILLNPLYDPPSIFQSTDHCRSVKYTRHYLLEPTTLYLNSAWLMWKQNIGRKNQQYQPDRQEILVECWKKDNFAIELTLEVWTTSATLSTKYSIRCQWIHLWQVLCMEIERVLRMGLNGDIYMTLGNVFGHHGDKYGASIGWDCVQGK